MYKKQLLLCLMVIGMNVRCFAGVDQPCKQIITNEVYYGDQVVRYLAGQELAKKCDPSNECSNDFECKMYRRQKDYYPDKLPNDYKTYRRLQELQQKPEFDSIMDQHKEHRQILRDVVKEENTSRNHDNRAGIVWFMALVVVLLFFCLKPILTRLTNKDLWDQADEFVDKKKGKNKTKNKIHK